MLFKSEEFEAMIARFTAMSLEELNSEFDKVTDNLSNFTVKIDKTFAEQIIAFLQTPILNSGFAHAVGAVSLYNNLTAKTKACQINIVEVRTLQTLLVQSKPTHIGEMIKVTDLMNALNDTNINVGKLEEQSRQLSFFIQKKEDEIKTGLGHADGDIENAAKLEIAK